MTEAPHAKQDAARNRRYQDEQRRGLLVTASADRKDRASARTGGFTWWLRSLSRKVPNDPERVNRAQDGTQGS